MTEWEKFERMAFVMGEIARGRVDNGRPLGGETSPANGPPRSRTDRAGLAILSQAKPRVGTFAPSGRARHMTGPVRIQRKRAKGWRMPPNTVSVTRPSKWGNPWKVERFSTCGCHDPRDAVRLFRKHEAHRLAKAARQELAGKNLACFCPLDQPCHADVLLELANGTSLPLADRGSA